MTYSKPSAIEMITLLNQFENATTNAAFYLYSNKVLADAERNKAQVLKDELRNYILSFDDKVILTQDDLDDRLYQARCEALEEARFRDNS